MVEIEQTKLVIVDDDTDFSDILSIYLRKIGMKNIIVAHNFQTGKQLIDSEKPGLILLDIDLKGKESGVDLGIYVREKYPNVNIIYFTNNFTKAVFDTVKPVKPDAFLDKQLDELKVRQVVELTLMRKMSSLDVEPTAPPQYCYFAKEFIFVRVGNIFKKIEWKDVDYIFYADRYANLQLGNKSYSLNMTIKDLARNLPEPFLQIHQSYIVNLEKIGQVNMTDNQVEVVGKWLSVGKNFRKNLRDKLLFLS